MNRIFWANNRIYSSISVLAGLAALTTIVLVK